MHKTSTTPQLPHPEQNTAVKSETLSRAWNNATFHCGLIQTKLEQHSVERIYLQQRSFDASKPRVTAPTGGE